MDPTGKEELLLEAVRKAIVEGSSHPYQDYGHDSRQ